MKQLKIVLLVYIMFAKDFADRRYNLRWESKRLVVDIGDFVELRCWKQFWVDQRMSHGKIQMPSCKG